MLRVFVQDYELFSSWWGSQRFFEKNTTLQGNLLTAFFLQQETYVICALSILCTRCHYAAATISCQNEKSYAGSSGAAVK